MKGVRELIKGIGKDEARFVLFVSAVLAVLTSLTGIRATIYAAGHGLVWVGTRFLSPGDASLYLSEIGQAKAGRLFAENLFTVDRMSGIFNVFWWTLGRAARVLSVSPLFIYEAARVLLIPVLAFTSYAVISRYFEDAAERAFAFFLFMAGSGLGAVYAVFRPVAETVADRYDWPLDLWVAESNAFLSMVYSPNFIASLALIIASAYLLHLALERGSVRHGLAAGLASLVLFQFHPYHVATLYAVGGAYLVLLAVERRVTSHACWAYLAYVAASAPSVAYHALVTYGDASKGAWFSSADVMLTPHLPFVLIGYGIIAPLAVIGFVVADPRDRKWRFLAVWAVVQSVLLYAPLMFQRRLTEGLQFPLAVLAANALIRGARAVSRKPEPARTRIATVAVLLLGVLLFSSTAYAAYWSVASQVEYPSAYFMSRDLGDAIAWLAANGGGAPVLASPETGYLIVGGGGGRVYAGHWQLTRDLEGKTEEIRRFYSSMPPGDRRRFLTDNGFGYVVIGPGERAMGATADAVDGLTLVHDSGTVQVWKTTREK